MSEYAFVTYGLAFKAQEGPRQYGLVRRGGRVHVRNYRREVRGGMSFWGVMEWRSKSLLAEMKALSGTTCFVRGAA